MSIKKGCIKKVKFYALSAGVINYKYFSNWIAFTIYILPKHFFFHVIAMLCSWNFQVFINQTIPSTSKAVLSGVLAHEEEYIFEYLFWIVISLVMKLDQFIHKVIIGNIFRKYLTWFGWLDPKSRRFLILILFSLFGLCTTLNWKPVTMS